MYSIFIYCGKLVLVSCLKRSLLSCLQCVAANGAGHDNREENGVRMQTEPHSEVCASSS